MEKESEIALLTESLVLQIHIVVRHLSAIKQQTIANNEATYNENGVLGSGRAGDGFIHRPRGATSEAVDPKDGDGEDNIPVGDDPE